MSRRYAEPVEVSRGDVAPTEFRWRGRRYLVRAVLDHWREVGRWWRQPRAVRIDDREREFWRVEAGADRGTGVFDLCFDWSVGGWTVARIHD
ncbi:MAG TPA: DUF6504 family protein [Mycobacteriales bacterium]|nr:DUF6504 family protein [Mycobacteriales bacterium]